MTSTPLETVPAAPARTAGPLVARRVRSLLRLDFYRLFHTPAFFIMLVVAAIIPAMVVALSGADLTPPAGTGSPYAAGTPAIEMPVIENTWQLIETSAATGGGAGPLDLAGFANINMVFIFAGLLMAIFIAHDYSSGFVKNIFTVHSRRIDYVVSKSAVGIFSGTAMILTYTLGTVLGGALTGKSFEVDVAGLILCLVAKVFLMPVFAGLFLAVAVFFRSRFWLTVVFTFLFGMMLYPAASFATLDSTVVTVLIALAVGAGGALAFGALSARFLERRDLA